VTVKKPFKFEMWMLGLIIVPIGIGISIYDAATEHTVPLGGECIDRDDCAAPADACLSIDSRSICTMQCGQCPAGFTCEDVAVTMHNRAGFHNLDMRYCLPNRP
jgi:hypothetical protein